jgi:hypothetical protein
MFLSSSFLHVSARTLVLGVCASLLSLSAKADEGMWLPLLLKQYNEAAMKAKGFRLTADDIYNVNKSSLKDAIVHFGGGCTGELISPDGLLLTNHHCGLGQVQSHSSVEKDYITNGFWAMSRKEELPNAGLTASFIVRMEDVTKQILEGIAPDLAEAEREKLVQQNIAKVSKAAVEGTHYQASIKPYYYGQEYYMYVTETYRDVRLVGAPPLSIGNFGGDTDNWMWPRHTGDFSMFRVYSGPDGKPADFNAANIPLKSKHFLPISLGGVDKGDFTMVFGFPGRTTEYLSSYGVAETYDRLNPARIAIRTEKLRLLKEAMRASDKTRIQYQAKYNSISNYHKKWTGENRGLKKLNAVAKKEAQEAEFRKWAAANGERQAKYGQVLDQLRDQYEKLKDISLAREYVNEAANGVELVNFSSNFVRLVEMHEAPNRNQAEIDQRLTTLKKGSENFFKNYNAAVDRKLFQTLLPMYAKGVPAHLQPAAFADMNKRYKGSWEKYASEVYEKSMLAKPESVQSLLSAFNAKNIAKLKKDPAYLLSKSISDLNKEKITPAYQLGNDQINLLQRTYVAGLREMNPGKSFYPDANSTLRVSYGAVADYEPADGVNYVHYTTIDGIMEKNASGAEDYVVPAKLKELYQKKDFGRYAENGTLPVAFTASNHTTGGNSGSPVINANGHLIGTNFDRNWEGTMSDIMYDPERVRNITLDVRYTLFLIDKFAGAGYLLKEMTLLEPEPETAAAGPAESEIDYAAETKGMRPATSLEAPHKAKSPEKVKAKAKANGKTKHKVKGKSKR